MKDLQKAVVMAGDEPQGQVVRRQLEFERREIVLELLEGARADDRSGHMGLCE